MLAYTAHTASISWCNRSPDRVGLFAYAALDIVSTRSSDRVNHARRLESNSAVDSVGDGAREGHVSVGCMRERVFNRRVGERENKHVDGEHQARRRREKRLCE